MSFTDAYSVAASTVAIGISLWALRHASRSADAAERQANAAEAALPPPQRPVDWELTRIGGDRYALRNTGTRTASGVAIDPTRALCAIRFEDHPTPTIDHGGSAVVLIMPTVNKPAPQEIWVSWEGQAEPVPVAVPSSRPK